MTKQQDGAMPAGPSGLLRLAVRAWGILLWASWLSGCGGGDGGSGGTYPVPVINSLSPSSTAACGIAFTLTINGNGFTPGSVVQWNGATRTTSYVSPTELTVAITAADVGATQTITVTVENPLPPGSDPMTSLLYTVNAFFDVECGNRVSMDAASPALATIDKDVFGVNLTGAMDLTSSNANYNTMMSTFRSANFGMVRWPLAGLSDYYHWQTNSFSACAAAYAPVSRTTFDQFMQQVAQPLGLDVNITVNYGSNATCSGGGDPNEAAAWVDYANNQMHYGIRYWTIGNEQYYGSPTLGAAFTTPDFNVAPSAPGAAGSSTYASLVATQFYPLMKAKDPTIQIGVDLVVPDNSASSRTMPWDATVLANAQFDFVEVHWYGATPPNVAATDAYLLSDGVSYFSNALQQLQAELVTAGKGSTPIYVGEWGIPGANNGSQQDITIVGALYTALVLGEMTKGGIRMAGVWEGFDSGPCVSTQPVSGVDSAQNWYTPSLFEAIAGGTNPACPSITQPALGTAFPRAIAINMVQQVFNAGDTVFAPAVGAPLAAVRAYGTRRANGYGLLLVNTDKVNSLPASVVIANDGRKFSASGLAYDQAMYQASVSNDWSSPAALQLGTVSGSFSVTLNPWSITTITLSATP